MQLYEEFKELKQSCEDVLIECDELGMEPTIPTLETGAEIVNRWRKHLKVVKE